MKGCRVGLAADHGGVAYKDTLKRSLEQAGYAVRDFGSFSPEPADYPDFSFQAAEAVAKGECDRAILICKSGIGMSIAANKVRGVRAALVQDLEQAKLSRQHNDANVLVLGAQFVEEGRLADLCRAWLETSFEGGRHGKRVEKISAYEAGAARNSHGAMMRPLKEADPDVFDAIVKEIHRQNDKIELIASENFVSRAVLEAQGSVLTNKYAEGYPGKRWYGGCEWVDVCEQLAIDRAKELFKAEHVNVQPHSGTSANIAVYMALLKPGDKILAMDLAHGGHLTHGHKLNFSGKYFEIIPYGVSPKDEHIDYDNLEELARKHQPRMILMGASAYPRIIDFKRGREIADKVGAYLMVDMAHIAGLVAAGLHPSPIPHGDVVTTTTHKTLRGPRSGMIFCREAFAKEIDKAVFPGAQGGPLMHVVAAKAVALKEAMTEEFREYQRRIVANAQALARGMAKHGFRIVSGGTDNHLMLVDVTSRGSRGKDVQEYLDTVNITVNKNMIPFDKESPFVSSGIRLGTPAVTTRGFGEAEMEEIAALISETVEHHASEKHLRDVRSRVQALTGRFPLYQELLS